MVVKHKLMLDKHSRIPFLGVALRKDTVTKHQLEQINTILLNTFSYEPELNVHTMPYGLSWVRVELNSHQDVALCKFFNVLGEWNLVDI